MGGIGAKLPEGILWQGKTPVPSANCHMWLFVIPGEPQRQGLQRLPGWIDITFRIPDNHHFAGFSVRLSPPSGVLLPEYISVECSVADILEGRFQRHKAASLAVAKHVQQVRLIKCRNGAYLKVVIAGQVWRSEPFKWANLSWVVHAPKHKS